MSRGTRCSIVYLHSWRNLIKRQRIHWCRLCGCRLGNVCKAILSCGGVLQVRSTYSANPQPEQAALSRLADPEQLDRSATTTEYPDPRGNAPLHTYPSRATATRRTTSLGPSAASNSVLGESSAAAMSKAASSNSVSLNAAYASRTAALSSAALSSSEVHRPVCLRQRSCRDHLSHVLACLECSTFVSFSRAVSLTRAMCGSTDGHFHQSPVRCRYVRRCSKRNRGRRETRELGGETHTAADRLAAMSASSAAINASISASSSSVGSSPYSRRSSASSSPP